MRFLATFDDALMGCEGCVACMESNQTGVKKIRTAVKHLAHDSELCSVSEGSVLVTYKTKMSSPIPTEDKVNSSFVDLGWVYDSVVHVSQEDDGDDTDEWGLTYLVPCVVSTIVGSPVIFGLFTDVPYKRSPDEFLTRLGWPGDASPSIPFLLRVGGGVVWHVVIGVVTLAAVSTPLTNAATAVIAVVCFGPVFEWCLLLFGVCLTGVHRRRLRSTVGWCLYWWSATRLGRVRSGVLVCGVGVICLCLGGLLSPSTPAFVLFGVGGVVLFTYTFLWFLWSCNVLSSWLERRRFFGPLVLLVWWNGETQKAALPEMVKTRFRTRHSRIHRTQKWL